MSLPDPKPGGSGEADDEGDRRASTGDFSVPIITSVSPGVDSVTEGTHIMLVGQACGYPIDCDVL